MKTVKEYLETLPEPYRSKALRYAYPHLRDQQVPSLFAALSSFNWHETPENDIYWRSLCQRIRERDRILEKLNTINPKRYTSKQIIDELTRWAKEI